MSRPAPPLFCVVLTLSVSNVLWKRSANPGTPALLSNPDVLGELPLQMPGPLAQDDTLQQRPEGFHSHL